MGHRTLQMLLNHYWRWIPTNDLSAEDNVFAGERSDAVGLKSCPPYTLAIQSLSGDRTSAFQTVGASLQPDAKTQTATIPSKISLKQVFQSTDDCRSKQFKVAHYEGREHRFEKSA
jgi:hypothetical protein